MKKRIKGYTLSRTKGARHALYRTLVRAFMHNGSIETTYTKAKMVQPRIEKLVQKAKKDDLSTRRSIYADLANNREVTDYLFNVVSKAFTDKKNGYTKLSELGVRRGDNAKVVRLEWSVEVPAYVSPEEKKKQEAKEKKSKTKTKKK